MRETQNATTSDDLLLTSEVSKTTRISESTLRYMRQTDAGPASFKLGRRVVYRRNEVQRWMAAREAATKRGGAHTASNGADLVDL